MALFLEHISVGGPVYHMQVRALGYTPASRDDVYLSFGPAAGARCDARSGRLPACRDLSVNGVVDSRINPGEDRTLTYGGRLGHQPLPIFGRDFSSVALLSPQVLFSPNGFSFGGVNDRLNSVQLDGAAIQDLKQGFGREAGLIALPPEAVKEVKVLSAPFDVRYGNFAGGLIQAVSKSGSNRWEGSVYGDLEGLGLNGTNPDGTKGGQNTRHEAGLTLGLPIVHDRLAGFVSANGIDNLFFTPRIPTPDTTGGAADSAGVGIRYATMVRFQEILRNTYGVDPGTIASGGFRFSNRSLFAKLTAQLGINSRLELSHDYLYHKDASPFTGGFNAGFTSNAEQDPTHDNTTQLNWTAAFGARWANELVLARTSRQHRCIPNSSIPTIKFRRTTDSSSPAFRRSAETR